jgi:cytochrome c5
MKNATLIFLCCSAFLTACDNNSDTDIASTTGDAVSDMSKKASDSIDNAIDSTVEAVKDTADNVVDSAQEKTTAVIESAKESASNAVNTVKGAGENVIQDVTDKADTVIASVVTSDMATDNKEGETIFKNKCNACHGAGIAGSPKLGDKAAWVSRLAQGKALLVEHAIKGFRGKEGYYMPPKGGSMDLSDDQVALVVEFMMSRVQ